MRTLNGQSQAEIASDLGPIIGSVLAELDRWLSV